MLIQCPYSSYEACIDTCPDQPRELQACVNVCSSLCVHPTHSKKNAQQHSCEPGKFATLSWRCEVCSAGKYQPLAGVSSCSWCPMRYTAKSRGQSACQRCTTEYSNSARTECVHAMESMLDQPEEATSLHVEDRIYSLGTEADRRLPCTSLNATGKWSDCTSRCGAGMQYRYIKRIKCGRKAASKAMKELHPDAASGQVPVVSSFEEKRTCMGGIRCETDGFKHKPRSVVVPHIDILQEAMRDIQI